MKRPAEGEDADELHIIRPSESLLGCLKAMAGQHLKDYIQGCINSIPAGSYNVYGGMGLFGAYTEYVEDYSDYNSSMKAYYKELYDKYDKWLEGGRLRWPDDVTSFL